MFRQSERFPLGRPRSRSEVHIRQEVIHDTHIVLLGASPEVDAACVAGDVEHRQALQTRQGHGNAITLEEEGRGERVKRGVGGRTEC